MKLPSPRRFKTWLVAAVSLIAVTLNVVAPMKRPQAQSPPISYTITDLGSTFGGTESKAFAINSCGQIAGYATEAGNSKRPFFRPASSLINLGVLSGNGTAKAVNNSGYVVGNSPTGTSSDRAFIWHDDNGNNANDFGEMKELLPAGTQSSAEDINDNGRVVGWREADSSGSLGFESFIWENNSSQTMTGSPAHPSPLAYSINNAGTIVGEDSTLGRGFILRNGIFTDIPPFPGANKSTAYAVSEAEHVVGAAAVDSAATPILHAFIWTDGPGLKDLGTLTGKTRSIAYNVAIVNGSVQVVGTSHSNIDASDTRAFVWQDLDADGQGLGDANEMQDLNALISPADPTWVLQEARSINSSGQIVGFGTKNGETHAFLLTPTTFTPSQCLPNVNVSVSPSAINEDAGGLMTYRFTRSIVTSSPLTVNFSTTGTAGANDYGISAVSTVQIPANMASATVTVTPMADTTDEPNETVILTVTADVANYSVGAQNAATGTITDDDGIPTIQITSVIAPEPVSGSTTFAFTVSLTNPSSSQITVNYATDTTGATATGGAGPGCGAAGVDFVNILSTGLTFLAGETSKQVSVTVCSDSNLEPDETFFVNLSGNSPNSNLATGTKGTGTITPPTPSIFVELGTETNPVPTAAVVDSVTFVRGPFRLINNNNLSNEQPPATRIIIFTSPLGMTNADLPSGILSVRFNGSAIPPANIEHVGPIAVLSGSYIIVKLPDNLPNPMPGPNNLTLTLKMGSATSNATLLSITP